jgi:hypothetical protein
MDLHSADGLVVHLTRDPRVVVLEYEVHGTAPSIVSSTTTASVPLSPSKIKTSSGAIMDSLLRAGSVDS